MAVTNQADSLLERDPPGCCVETCVGEGWEEQRNGFTLQARSEEGLSRRQRTEGYGEADATGEACLENSCKSHGRGTGCVMGMQGTGVEKGRLLAWVPRLMMAFTWRGHTGMGRGGEQLN